jgi:hypothetical protein
MWLLYAVDLFKASVFRDADFFTLRKLDDSPGLAVFLDMLDDKQLTYSSTSSLSPQVGPLCAIC